MAQRATAVETNAKVLVTRPEAVPATVIGAIEQVRPGSVLLRPGTALPSGLELPLRRVGRWNMVFGRRSAQIEQALRDAGWHYFFVVPPVEAGGWGLSSASALRKAVGSSIAQVEARRLNALEITGVRVRRLLGVYYVSVAAQPRHVRNSPFILDLDPNHRIDGYWNGLGIFEVMNRKVLDRKGV